MKNHKKWLETPVHGAGCTVDTHEWLMKLIVHFWKTNGPMCALFNLAIWICELIYGWSRDIFYFSSCDTRHSQRQCNRLKCDQCSQVSIQPRSVAPFFSSKNAVGSLKLFIRLICTRPSPSGKLLSAHGMHFLQKKWRTDRKYIYICMPARQKKHQGVVVDRGRL